MSLHLNIPLLFINHFNKTVEDEGNITVYDMKMKTIHINKNELTQVVMPFGLYQLNVLKMGYDSSVKSTPKLKQQELIYGSKQTYYKLLKSS